MVHVVRPTGLVLLATATCPRTARPPAASRAHRVLYAAKTTVEFSGLVPGFDVAELIALLAHPGATVIDTAVIDGLVVAVGQRSRSTGSG